MKKASIFLPAMFFWFIAFSYGQEVAPDTISCDKRGSDLHWMRWRCNKFPQIPFEIDGNYSVGDKPTMPLRLGFKLSYLVERESPNKANAYGAEFGFRWHRQRAPILGKFSTFSIFVTPYWRVVIRGRECHASDFFVQGGAGIEYKFWAESRWFAKYPSFRTLLPYGSAGVGLFIKRRPDPRNPTDGPNCYVALMGNAYLLPYYTLPTARNTAPFWFSIQIVHYIARWRGGKYV